MKKADKVFIIIVLATAFLLYLPSLFVWYQSRHLEKAIVVSYRDEEVLRKPLTEDATYEIEGTLGIVYVEVKDQKVRVEKETSPRHLCSIQGWVEDISRPIVCLPNDVVVQIVSLQDDSDVDVIVQ